MINKIKNIIGFKQKLELSTLMIFTIFLNLIEVLKPQEMDPLLKDYIINKGNIKLGDKDVCMDLLKKKKEDE